MGKMDAEAAINAVTLTMEAGLARLEAQVSRTRDAVRLRGCEARPVLASGLTVVSTSPGRLMGFLLANLDGGTAARLRLYNGRDAGAELLGTVTLAPGESVRDFFGPSGVGFSYGLAVVVESGSIDGTVLVGAA